MIVLFILLGLILWIACGFIAFLIEVKREKWRTFDYEAREEFKYALLGGILSLIYIICVWFCSWFFDKFMEGLMYKDRDKRRKNHVRNRD